MAALRGAGRYLVGVVRGPDGAWEIGPEPEPGGRLVQRGKKGGDRIGPTRCGKGSKIMAIADSHGFPVAVGVTSASPNESTLVESTLDRRHIGPLPRRMIGDKAYDSDPLDERLRQRGIVMIAPNRQKRRKNTGWKATSPLSTPLEDRTSVCMAQELPAHLLPLGTTRR